MGGSHAATMVHYVVIQEQKDGVLGKTQAFKVEYDTAIVATLDNNPAVPDDSQDLLNFIFGIPASSSGPGYSHVAGDATNNAKYFNFGGNLGFSVRGFVINGDPIILAPVGFDGNYWASSVHLGGYDYIDFDDGPLSGNYTGTGWEYGRSGQTGRLLGNNSIDAYVYGDGSAFPTLTVSQIYGLNYQLFASGAGYTISYLVPEPGRAMLLLAGLVMVVGYGRRRVI